MQVLRGFGPKEVVTSDENTGRRKLAAYVCELLPTHPKERAHVARCPRAFAEFTRRSFPLQAVIPTHAINGRTVGIGSPSADAHASADQPRRFRLLQMDSCMRFEAHLTRHTGGASRNCEAIVGLLGQAGNRMA